MNDLLWYLSGAAMHGYVYVDVDGNGYRNGYGDGYGYGYGYGDGYGRRTQIF